MGKLILQMQSSVDGFVGTAENLDWTLWSWGDEWPWDPALRRRFNAQLTSARCILLSRPMAEQGYLEHWKHAGERHGDDPDWAFARRVGELSKIVYSRAPLSFSRERTDVRSGPVDAVVAGLKRETDGDIICFGGATFGSLLLETKMVDEVQLYLNPAAVGAGFPLFRRFSSLRLISAEPFPCGMAVLRYAPLECGDARP